MTKKKENKKNAFKGTRKKTVHDSTGHLVLSQPGTPWFLPFSCPSGLCVFVSWLINVDPKREY